MKKIVIKKEVDGWEEVCKECGKAIQGISKSQVEYNFKRHEEACNGNKE